MQPKALLFTLFVSGALALEIPPNVQGFYSQLRNRSDCSNKLASGFFNSQFEGGDMSYCGDHLGDYGIVYLQGPGKLSNMDVDCDGVQGGPQDDGRCDESSTTIPETSVGSIIQDYDVGIDDLNPHEHSYVVFGNSNSNGKPGWKTFDPQEVGVDKASVMAIVCGDHIFYGVWGDSNGDHGDRPSVGEASLALATACFGESMNGGSGSDSSHNDADVLFIAFTGGDAVPGPDGADWAAGNFDDFHASLVDLGEKLVQRIGNGSGGGDSGDPDEGDTCSWSSHCEGASCSAAQDCADDLACVSGACSSCSWPGHCSGAACKVAQDCADSLTCVGGKCA